ncbi:uncharacterized protein Z518_11298 [Rhinocladiella mackenziei CBS 650.93]|uniref:Rhinocladiella mackenziei CBS 650.93 unplaced genomic scaffold supercont1.12, whole genome shotgun sequence n=1 Tax=Rhinocladiella mackenziei CBS 650.93 TaxID=1442369 RepID=A0A0D2IS64_9EURO|nr:uncharacterized protein Z518_11298 [Rhinocladiella mackenziei CBS 650.93]KIW99559.1 hypothetical protein Z518_11298 [Rhinocladiella mackenziei CBS 650.93]
MFRTSLNPNRSLDEEDFKEGEKIETIGKNRRRRTWIAIVLLFVVVDVFFLYSVVSNKENFNGGQPQGDRKTKPCGSTVEEAKAAGCSFDHLAHLWLPKSCSRQWSSEYMTYEQGQPFKSYLDGDGLQPVELSEQPYHTGIFSTTKEHLIHCAYALMRTSEWMKQGGQWERKVLSPAHFQHCIKMLLNASMLSPQIEALESFTYLGFSDRCYDNVVG